ncbi:MAG: zinc-binding dehydrogenase [Micromonosporaceae bacterium]
MSLIARGVVVRAPGEASKVEELIVEEPGPGEVLVRIQATGVCHTDMHASRGTMGTQFPYLLGHEGAGVVQAVGPGVSRPAVGDPVVLAYRVPCDRCRYCLRGAPARCATPPEAGPRLRARSDGQVLTRVSRLGTFATHTVVAASQAITIPPGIAPEAACLIGCGVMTGYGAVAYTADLHPGRTVAVFGCGGVGINVVQGARLLRAERVIAVDVSEQKLGWAQAFGATHTIDAKTEDPVTRIKELTGGLGVDAVFDTVGQPRTVLQALRSCDFGGRCVLLAIPETAATVEIGLSELHWQRCDIRSSWYGDCLPASDFPMLATWYLRGDLMLDELITARIGLGDVADAFAALSSGTTLRSVIVPDH